MKNFTFLIAKGGEIMKKLFSLVALLVLFSITSAAFADEYVRGYFRRDGTYVPGYYRSSPDSNPYNNYSFPGNVNPYTGKRAPGNPDTYIDRYYNPYSNPYQPYRPYGR